MPKPIRFSVRVPSQNQKDFMRCRNVDDNSKSERSPSTESMPHLGQSAVCPSPFVSSVHSSMSRGENVVQQ